MAKKNISPDYINWVLTLNAKQVQEEYHKLEKSNKELQKQTNASRKAMAQLEAEVQKILKYAPFSLTLSTHPMQYLSSKQKNPNNSKRA